MQVGAARCLPHVDAVNTHLAASGDTLHAHAMTLARTLTIPVAGSRFRLEGRHVAAIGAARDPQPLALIAPPHPMYGGTFGNPVVRVMEAALQARGLSTLAFNFRGTGESEGEPSGEYEDSLADYLGAARALPTAELSWLTGYSFGSVAALACAIELDAPRVLMVAPPLGMLDPTLLTRYRGLVAVVVGTADEYAPVEPLQELFGPRPNTTLELLPDVEHFFLGSDVQHLAQGLARLLAQTDSSRPTHA
ncbi:MAG: alpha/beta hydrolase [Myxococcaceae bacterium]|nr:alpha/beta hydrolase [Myxococcaceae bacterium]